MSSRENRPGVRGLVVLAVLLLLWWGVCRLEIWSAYLLPSPGRVARALAQLWTSGELQDGVLTSLRRVGLGFLGACCAALILGVLNGLMPRLAAWTRPVVHFVRNIPPLSLAPLLILWCGIGERAKVLLIFLAAFFPLFLNVEKGISGCSPALLEVGRAFGLSPWRRFWKIILPSALPDILVGMQIALGYSWRAIVGAEMVAASSGLGHLILDAQYMARTDRVIACILVIGLLGYLCNRGFEGLVGRVLRRGTDDGD